MLDWMPGELLVHRLQPSGAADGPRRLELGQDPRHAPVPRMIVPRIAPIKKGRRTTRGLRDRRAVIQSRYQGPNLPDTSIVDKQSHRKEARMNIEGTSVYVGPNVHAKEPLIRLTIDIKPPMPGGEELGARVLDQLLAVLRPGAQRGRMTRTGWPTPAPRTTSDLGELLAKLALELQRSAAGERGQPGLGRTDRRPGCGRSLLQLRFRGYRPAAGSPATCLPPSPMPKATPPRPDRGRGPLPALCRQAHAGPLGDGAGARPRPATSVVSPERRQLIQVSQGQVSAAHRGRADQPDLAYRGSRSPRTEHVQPASP